MSRKTEQEVSITAVPHTAGHKGPSHVRFPEVNMRKTAELLGIHKSHLARALRGECRASLEMSIKIAKAFGISVEELNSYYKPEEKRKETSHAKSKSSGRPRSRTRRG